MLKMKSEEIISVMEKVADWQLHHLHEDPGDHHPAGWIYAAFYIGLIALARMTEAEVYFDLLEEVGRKYRWQLQERIYMADDHAVGQMYIDLYEKRKDPAMIRPTQAAAQPKAAAVLCWRRSRRSASRSSANTAQGQASIPASSERSPRT